MKLLIILSLLISHAFAGNAVLLTSLELPQKKLAKIEKQFLKAFNKSDLTPVIHHKAGPRLLFESMKSEDNEVVIWVSHAAGEKALTTGMNAENIILDIFGNDVKKFFTSPSKSMRFLGIVGCEAQSIIDGFKARGQYQDVPELEIMSFNKKVDLFHGLNKALDRSMEVLQRSSEETEHPEKEVIQIEVSRTASQASGWIELGDKVVGYFDPQAEKTSTTLPFDYQFWNSLENKNIKFIRDLQGSSADLGKLNLAADGSSWKLFASTDGKALGGKNQQLYIFKK